MADVTAEQWRHLADAAGRQADWYRRLQARLSHVGVEDHSPLHGYCRLARWNAERIEAVALDLASEATAREPTSLPRWVNRRAPG